MREFGELKAQQVGKSGLWGREGASGLQIYLEPERRDMGPLKSHRKGGDVISLLVRRCLGWRAGRTVKRLVPGQMSNNKGLL